MNNGTHTLPFAQILSYIGKPVTYYPTFAHALNDINAALFLSNFMYWEGKQADATGWIYKRQCDILEETGLSRTKQENARRVLRDLAILEEKKSGQPAKLHFRFDWDRVDVVLSEYFTRTGGPPKQRRRAADPDTGPEPKAINLLGKMMDAFDVHYTEQTGGISFDWGKSKQAKGKSMENLKRLRDFFNDRIGEKQRKEALADYEGKLPVNWEPEITPEMVLHSFEHFLKELTPYHRKTYLTPEHLYSHINKIILDIIAHRNGNRTNEPADSNAVAAAFE